MNENEFSQNNENNENTVNNEASENYENYSLTLKNLLSAEQNNAENTGSADDALKNIYADNKAPDSDNKKEEKVPFRASVFDWIKTFVTSLIVVIFIFTFISCGVMVIGNSMNRTLSNGDYLMISKLLYTPKTGDIIVIKSPDYHDPIIKRVIGTSGQKIKINFETWEVEVDGVLMADDFVNHQYSPFMNTEDIDIDENNCAEITVKDGCVFVMGDNRNDSLDSRSNDIGQIDEHYIIGKVLFRIFPISKFGKV